MNTLIEKRYNLVQKFLTEAGLWNSTIEKYLKGATFQSQEDGGMGSFSISEASKRIGTRDYADAEYIDTDGKKVVIALIGDEEGYPTDMDFWKVDSSPLIRFPNPDELRITVK